MKLVKMITAILLVLAVSAAILAGCSKPNDAGEISDYDSQAFIPVGGNSQSGTESEPHAASGESAGSTTGGNGTVSGTQTQSGGFLVSEKKYDFDGNNLVVLNVENQTDKNYSIAIHMTYLDESGVILQEETKTFEGFAAGWKNYFFFLPEIAFDRFSYTLQAEEYDGECYAHKLQYSWKLQEFARGITSDDWIRMEEELSEYRDAIANGESDVPLPQEYYTPCIDFKMGYVYEAAEAIVLAMDVVILDSQGAVLYVEPLMFNHVKIEPQGEFTWRSDRTVYFFSDPSSQEWPEEWKGDLTVLFGTVDAFLYDPNTMIS